MDKEQLRSNLDDVIANIEQARLKVSHHHIVKLVVAGKYTSVENITTLYSLGQRAFGENQVQQLESRNKELEELPLEWHMIGTLQKNKINKLLALEPFLLQSLDSLELAEALEARLATKGQKLDCLLQINSSNEETKSGTSPEIAIDLYQQIATRCQHINLKGVMSIGANTSDNKIVQKSFEETFKIFEKLQKEGATICSMGMSGDYELAIKCGSNLVRIGSALFRN
ncbi:MAG TPA: YggS family pyridoxal phosphate-dependent enzyme [Epsilonproteobacteria bacterium]|nr:YggS family pyridoxal phosphate-dependent enzyme [Campylobacterota bacterium]